MPRKWRRELPIAALREAFLYLPDGRIVNAYTRGPAIAGEDAGCPNGKGYILVGFNRMQILAHRIVWALHHDVVPDHLDHENGNGMDNRVENLRECTQSKNNQNMKPRSKKHGTRKGVTMWSSKGITYYRARIVVDKKEISLGYFDTEQEAYDAYCKAAAERFGAFARAA